MSFCVNAPRPQACLGSFQTGRVGHRHIAARAEGRFLQDGSRGKRAGTSFDWTDGYAALDVSAFHDDDPAGSTMAMPVMTLKKVKVVTDTVQLNIFEPRYRTMFRLVKRSRSRVFGVTLRAPRGVSDIGVLCELTHFVPVPTRKSIFISARAIGRFEIKSIVHSKPFLCADCKPLYDDGPALSESDIWGKICDVRELVGSLTGVDGDEALSLEVRRWSPDRGVRDTVRGSISSHPRMIGECYRAGLMGDANPTPITSVSRESLHCEDSALAFIASEARMSAEERECRRAEKHSFALARSLDLEDDVLLDMMRMRSTDDRLALCGSVIADSERYLRARSAIQQLDLDN